MAKNQRIVFSFDDSGFRSGAKPVEEKREPIVESTDKGDHYHVIFTDPVSGVQKELKLPKNMERPFPSCF